MSGQDYLTVENRLRLYPPANRIALILSLLFLISVLHWLLPVSPHVFHGVHIVLRKMFIVPIVLAGAWYGWRGAFVAAAISTLLYGPHVLFDWSNRTSENLNQISDIVMFWAIGLLSGYLFDRYRVANHRSEQAHRGTLDALALALDAREHDTDRHSERVADLATRLGRAVNLPDTEIEVLREAARLHDVGKIGVPDRILLKPGPLNDAERRLMQSHVEIGCRIVGRMPSLQKAAELIRFHHERFDGTGYPRGLKGDEIPLAAKVFAVADVFDALTNDRPYRLAMSPDEAISVIKEQTGQAFAPDIMAVFETVAAEPGFPAWIPPTQEGAKREQPS